MRRQSPGSIATHNHKRAPSPFSSSSSSPHSPPPSPHPRPRRTPLPAQAPRRCRPAAPPRTSPHPAAPAASPPRPPSPCPPAAAGAPRPAAERVVCTVRAWGGVRPAGSRGWRAGSKPADGHQVAAPCSWLSGAGMLGWQKAPCRAVSVGAEPRSGACTALAAQVTRHPRSLSPPFKTGTCPAQGIPFCRRGAGSCCEVRCGGAAGRPGQAPAPRAAPPTHLGARRDAHRALVAHIPQRVHAHPQRALGRQHARDLALELGRRLADEGGVVDEAVLGRLVLGLQSPARGGRRARGRARRWCTCMCARVRACARA